MTRPILRVLIQETLANGRLPSTQIPRICGGPRSEQICDGGEETTIKAQQTRQDTPTGRTHPAMSKGLVRGLTLAAVAALGTMTCVASAGAAELIDSCTTLSTFGKTYALASDLTSCGTCLTVTADSITIDLRGHTISRSCPGVEQVRLAETDAAVGEEFMPIAGVTDGETQRLGTTVKNGTIKGFEYGVSLGSSQDNVIRNLEVSDNTAFGLNLGARSLVRGCTIERNGLYGILIGDFGRVHNCTISGPIATQGTAGSNGIDGGDNVLITNNTVVGNQTGIGVLQFGTVSRNTSSGNTFYGVLAGNGSVVTRNETNNNGYAGIDTGEGSTVSRNISNRNGGGGVLARDSSAVTDNTTNENGNAGIATVGPNTVSRNISNRNRGGGIDVGADGLSEGTLSWIAGNTTNDNLGVGLEAWCPSTLMNNKSSGNRLTNYKFNGQEVECVIKNNQEPQ